MVQGQKAGSHGQLRLVAKSCDDGEVMVPDSVPEGGIVVEEVEVGDGPVAELQGDRGSFFVS